LTGLQFIIWTESGLYFGWTAINEIHNDNFRNNYYKTASFSEFICLSALSDSIKFSSIQIKERNKQSYSWLNKNNLYNAITGKIKAGITEKRMIDNWKESYVNW